VAFTAHNAARNGLGGRIAAWGGLAYEGLAGRRFDAVFCNLPAKAGPPVHRAILLGAARHLASGGEAWVVVVRSLEQAADSILASGGAEVRLKAAGKEHVVYSYVLPGAPPPAEPSYERTRQSFQWRTWSYELTSLYGLAEFDTRSWLTNLLLDFYWQAFRRRRHEPRDVMVCNPTQGHVPVLLARMAGGLERMEIVSRDLLALQAVRRNLADNGFAGAVRCSHTAELCSAFGDANPQAILVTLREKEGLEVNLHKLRALAARYPQAAALVACRASFGARVLAALKAAGVPARPGRKKKGCCVFSLGEQPW